MFPKDSSKTLSNDEQFKENGRLSTRSKTGSIKFGEGDGEFQFHVTAQGSTLQEAHSNINQRSESVTLNHFQTKASNFSGVPSSPRKSSQIIHELEDAQAVIDKIDQPKEIPKAFEVYQPKSKDFDLAALRKLEKTKIKKYKASIFLGEFLNGKRHGKGIMISVPLRIYEGDWENDVKHGKGFEVLEQGSKYEGGYLNGKPEGFGTFLWANGESYEGEWKNGLKHGSGMWKGTKGESYLGEWKYGKAEGYGVHTWRNGDKYEGEFKGFLKHGHGTEKFVNGDYYIGNYTNGKPDGFGEYYWANGCHYKGDFKNGLRHGKGTWRKGTGNCDYYEGEWANDKKNGTGVYKWASGNRYLGSYFDDIRHGYGEMYWGDGSAYKGFWEKGIQHGEGQLIIPGKGNKRGIFEKNLLIEEMDTRGTDNDLFNNIEDTSILKESNSQSIGILGTPRRHGQVRPPKKANSKQREYNSSVDQNRNNESCLPEIRSMKANNFSLPIQPKEKRRNSSSMGPRRNYNERDSMAVKMEAQYGSIKGTEQSGMRKLQHLGSLSVNENIKIAINTGKAK